MKETVRWIAFALVLASMIVVCSTGPRKAPADAAARMLEQHAQGADGVSALLAALPARAALDVVERANVETVQPAVGAGIRPLLHVKAGAWPVVGRDFSALVLPFGYVASDGNASHRLLDVGCWLLVSFDPVPERPIYELPDGCPLWLDPGSPRTLVWSLRGSDSFADPLLRREQGAHAATIGGRLPAELQGQRVALQLVVIGPEDRRWRSSQVLRLTIGT